eukprot:6749981-Prymnesium_polylepis.1
MIAYWELPPPDFAAAQFSRRFSIAVAAFLAPTGAACTPAHPTHGTPAERTATLLQRCAVASWNK